MQRNITAFSGNSDNVTLLIVSAGKKDVHNLHSSAPVKGLLNKCIIASGPGFAHTLIETVTWLNPPRLLLVELLIVSSQIQGLVRKAFASITITGKYWLLPI